MIPENMASSSMSKSTPDLMYFEDVYLGPNDISVPYAANTNSCGETPLSKKRYVPPFQRLYRSRHKLTHKNISKSISLDNLVFEEHIDQQEYPTFNVPVIEPSNRSTVYSNCSSVFSSQHLPESDDDDRDLYSCNQAHSLSFKPGNELRRAMEKNLSLDSLILSNKRRISECNENLAILESSVKLDDSVDGKLSKKFLTPARPGFLPPMCSEEKQRHDKDIRAFYEHASHSEKQDKLKFKYHNRKLIRRSQQCAEQWSTISNKLASEDLLIEVRRRELYWDGIPWELRNKVYNTCLIKIDPNNLDKMDDPLLNQLQKSISKVFFQRSEEIFYNLVKRSSLLNNKIQNYNMLSEFEKTRPDLYFHIVVTLELDPIEEFLRPLLLHSLTNCIEKPQDDPGYEELVVRLFDVLILQSYYQELDNALNKMEQFLIRENSYKFFGSKREVREMVRCCTIDLYLLLEHLRN